jgi:diguanylate cyclase (GGDEF)-like protein
MADQLMLRLGKPQVGPLAAAAEVLLEARRPNASRALSSREKRVETAAAVSLVLAAFGLAAWKGQGMTVPVGQAAALVATYAMLARVRFAVGSGFTMPTQLAVVPMLMLLPPAIVPALVAIALVLSRAPELLRQEAPAERLLTSIADAWYVVPPALFLALIAPHGAIYDASWPLWIAALGLQLVGDMVASTLRESLGAGVSPTVQVGVVAHIAIFDVLLSGVGLLAAFGSQLHPYAFLLTVPLVAGLAVFARERAGRIAHALELVDELALERKRVLAAHRRIGETAAANLDRAALERIIVETAIELIEADAGRLSAGDRSTGPDRTQRSCGDPRELEELLCAIEDSEFGDGVLVEMRDGPATAIGLSIAISDEPLRVLAIARRDGTFVTRERDVLRTLAEQAAMCLQNLSLHERAQRLAATDELTGLINHRRLHEVLGREVRRAERYGTSLALVMLDVDDFKHVNDRYGHQQGDRVLRAVADAVRDTVRDVDFVARYGGEELAVALPEMDAEGAADVGERIRRAIAAAVVPERDGTRLSVTASVGVAVLDPASPSRQDLIAAADAALYRAKRAGKNRVAVARLPQAALEASRF